MDLVYVPVVGGVYTWFSGSGKAMSRIEIFVLSEGVISRWDILGQRVRKKDISDHCPIWIKAGVRDWGLKPFRFNTCWVKHEDFMSFVKVEWESILVSGRCDYILKEKLKALKGRLKRWN
ncbi:unnamed protein product [Lathyrus sativus]|nr:unnamed protein product [Lathyrus sativus]